jgi:hypothetical protein
MINTYEKKVLQPADIKAGPLAPPNGTTQCPGCGDFLPADPRYPVVICARCRVQVRKARG